MKSLFCICFVIANTHDNDWSDSRQNTLTTRGKGREKS